MTPIKPLTEKQITILQLSAQGMTSQEIASKIFQSARTVEFQRIKICGIMGCRNVTQAVYEAGKKGILK